MCLEIISEGANRILKASFFLPAFSSCPVKLMFRKVAFGGIKSPSEKQRAGIYSVFSEQKFKGPGPLKEELEM